MFDGSYNDIIEAIDKAAKKSNNVMYTGLQLIMANFVEEHFADIGLIALTAATGGQSALVNLLTKTYGVTSDVKVFVDRYRELEASGADAQEMFMGMAGCTGNFLIGKGVGKLGGLLGEKGADAVGIDSERGKILFGGGFNIAGGDLENVVVDYVTPEKREEDKR